MITSDDMIIFEQISVPFEGERDSPVCCNLALRFDIILMKKTAECSSVCGRKTVSWMFEGRRDCEVEANCDLGFLLDVTEESKVGFRSIAFEPQGHLLVITSARSPSPPPCSIFHPHKHRAVHNLWRLTARPKLLKQTREL